MFLLCAIVNNSIRESYNFIPFWFWLVQVGYKWDTGTKDWIFESKTVSYWSELNTSVFDNRIELNCIIYPNPTRDIITIETDRVDRYSIHITSLNGQYIYSVEMEGNSSQIDLSSFRNGVYFITVRSKGYVTTRKIVKQ